MSPSPTPTPTLERFLNHEGNELLPPRKKMLPDVNTKKIKIKKAWNLKIIVLNVDINIYWQRKMIVSKLKEL